MALITCPECGKEISDQAKKCNKCGYPLPKRKNKNISKYQKIALVFATLSVIVIACFIALTKSGFGKKTYYPTFSKVIKETTAEGMIGILGDDYTDKLSKGEMVTFHRYDNYNLDGIECDYLSVSTSNNDDSFYEFGFSGILENTETLNNLVNDVSNVFGEPEVNESYRWHGVKGLHPSLYYSDTNDGKILVIFYLSK